MSRKLVTYCEQCGGTALSGAEDFLVFHCLSFCSPECRDDYRTADEARRDARHAVAELATVARVMRRAPQPAPVRKRARAA